MSKLEYSNSNKTNFHGIRYDDHKIFLNNDNKKPSNISKNVMNTEFFVKRNKKNLLLNLGESWTYGESLGEIATASEKFDLHTQLDHCFGPKLSLLLDADIYQYAVPGNNNFYIQTELERILEYVTTLGYENIYVNIQITEPSREFIILDELRDSNHGFKLLYDKKYLKENRPTFQEWLQLYDKFSLEYIENAVSKYKNIKTLVWKNFCKFQHNLSTVNTVETTWIEFSATVNGHKLTSPDFYNVKWLNEFIKTNKAVQIENKYLNKQLKLIDISNKYLGSSSYHIPHPDETQHSLWALKLYYRWHNEI